MLKDYLKENNISMYKLANDSGVAYSTINDLANGRVEVSNCKAGMLRDLAVVLNVTMDDLYQICDRNLSVYSKKYDTNITVSVRNKTYYADFEYDGAAHHISVCEAGVDYIPFAKELALWDAEDLIEQKEWEKLNEILVNEKKRQDHNL